MRVNLFPNWARNILFLLVYILSGLALVIIMDGLMTGTELSPFNTAVELIVKPLRTPLLTEVMLFITNIGSPVVLSIAAVFLAMLLLVRRDTYDALLYIVAISMSIISFVVMKNVFAIARPEGGLVTLSSWSFPSGHATVSAAFFFVTSYSFLDWFKSLVGKTLLVTLSIVAAALISFSRLYLGVHYALDVLGGVALGLLSATFTLIIFNIFLEERNWFRRKRRIS